MVMGDSVFQTSVRRLLLGLGVLFAGLLLGACSAPVELPEAAEEALLDYWASLPSAPGLEHHIIQAWPGATPTESTVTLAPEMETWCVEARISAPNDPAVDGEKLIWIVIRDGPDAPWNAAMLAMMSSLWPYEACGTVP